MMSICRWWCLTNAPCRGSGNWIYPRHRYRVYLRDLQDPGLYPWMALVIFSDDELIIPQPASGPAPDPPQGSQQNPTRSASFALNNVVNATFNGTKTAGPPSGILGPTIGLEDDEDPKKIFCNVIDISTDTFTELIAAAERSAVSCTRTDRSRR